MTIQTYYCKNCDREHVMDTRDGYPLCETDIRFNVSRAYARDPSPENREAKLAALTRIPETERRVGSVPDEGIRRIFDEEWPLAVRP
jgi:hypothetical protein